MVPASFPYQRPAVQPHRKTVNAKAAADPTRAHAVTNGWFAACCEGGATQTVTACHTPSQKRPRGGWSGLW